MSTKWQGWSHHYMVSVSYNSTAMLLWRVWLTILLVRCVVGTFATISNNFFYIISFSLVNDCSERFMELELLKFRAGRIDVYRDGSPLNNEI